MRSIQKQFPIFILVLLSFVIFWKFFVYGLHPFPGNLLLGWHEPWRSEYFVDGRILLPNKPVADDVFKQIYPLRTLAIDMIKKLEPPLWNPYNGAGMPLLATLNNGFLDPFNLLFIILPYPFAWSIYIILQAALIGICTYLYCRKILLSNQASLFAAIVFMLSGFVTVRIIFGMYGLAIAILPFLLWILESYFHNKITKIIYLLPLAIFTLLASTQPQISLYIIAFISIYFLSRLIATDGSLKVKIKQGITIIFLFLIGFGLAAIQLLPTLELFQYAHINPGASSFIIKTHLLPIEHLLSMLIPNYFGNASLYNYWGAGDYTQTIAALGLIPVFFAYWSIGRIYDKLDLRFFFYTSAIATIALVIDWIGTQKIFSLSLPIFSTGAPSRILFLTIFSLAILSGYGFDNWFFAKKQFFKKTIFKILPFIVLTSGILLGTFVLYYNGTPCKYGVISYCRLVALRNTALETAVFGLFLPFFLTSILIQKSIFRRVISFVVFTLIVVLGVYNANKILPFSPLSSFFPQHPVIDALKQHAENGRIFGFGQASLTPNTETQFRLYSPQYYHPLYIARYRELLEYANNGKYITQLPRGEPHIRSESNPNPALSERREKLLTILGTTHAIFSKEDVPKEDADNIVWENSNRYIVERKNTLPRAYLVYTNEVIQQPEKILEKLFDPTFSPNTTVILEHYPKNFNYTKSKIETDKNSAIIKQYKENEVVIETNTDRNAILTLSDNYYPGWKAYVNNEEVSIYRANFTFRAVEVPKGKYTITFVYKPQSFHYGILISASSLIAFGIFVLFQRKNRFLTID